MDYCQELCEAAKGMTLEEASADIAQSGREVRDPDALAAFLLAGAPEVPGEAAG